MMRMVSSQRHAVEIEDRFGAWLVRRPARRPGQTQNVCPTPMAAPPSTSTLDGDAGCGRGRPICHDRRIADAGWEQRARMPTEDMWQLAARGVDRAN